MEAHRRTAFTATLVLDRRSQQGAAGAPITAVALGQGGQRLYLGLEDGVLEEHAIEAEPQGARASLSARKHAAKRVRRRRRRLLGLVWQPPLPCIQRCPPSGCVQAVVGIHHLASLGPSGGAALLVLLTEDGSVLLLDGDSLEGRPMPLR